MNIRNFNKITNILNSVYKNVKKFNLEMMYKVFYHGIKKI